MPIPVVSSLIGHVLNHGSAGGAGAGSHSKGQQQNTPTPKNRVNGVDKVELSASAPRPLDAPMLEKAHIAATKLTAGDELSAGEAARVHSDRVFAAVSVLLAMGMGSKDVQQSLPLKLIATGLPAPNAEELKTAFRRIHQRMDNLDRVRDPRGVQQVREQTISQLRPMNFEQMAEELFG